ncbi:glomulin-like isoform X2 [Dreissena polymorpha]|uniref:Glomulin n=1 Tax=Dreissena polymorpha TaxID=45954 RepID=A0A9D4IDX0_DREPO|nr:glomulin-like isoform X2 [Dreissena polymorpha]KAH3768817.1 hypothetical protein DPMN_170033 [Dreissena polymorpha]
MDPVDNEEHIGMIRERMDPIDNEERMKMIRECVAACDPLGVKKLILEDKLRDESLNWQLLSLLGPAVNEENFNSCPGFVEVCERCMKYLVTVGNPDELVYALLEQADSFDDHVRFQTFLGLTKICILRSPAKRLFLLELSLVTFSDCVAKLEIEGGETEEEVRAAEIDPVTEMAEHAVSAYLDFMATFVELDWKVEVIKETDQEQEHKILVKFLLKVLEHPLSQLDLGVRENHIGMKVKSTARILAEKVMALLKKLNKDLFGLLRDSVSHNDKLSLKLKLRRGDPGLGDELDKQSELGLSCMAYLLLAEDVAEFSLPPLMPWNGIYELCVSFFALMLAKKETAVRRKGVHLFSKLLQTQDGHVLIPYEDLDRPEYYRILGSLFDIMTHCSARDLRQKCVCLVAPFINLFDAKARYQMFIKMFGTLTHSGAVGFCVQLFKDQVDKSFNLGDQRLKAALSKYFSGLNLKRIFLLITKLEDKAATDLVEHSDRIISVLNLIRYLALRDPPQTNMSGFWDFIPAIEKDFLKLLYEGLDLTKGHYRLELSALQKGNQSQGAGEEVVDMCVSVAGFTLPPMARGQKVAILQQALRTLDLITGLVVRVEEILAQQRKTMTSLQ